MTFEQLRAKMTHYIYEVRLNDAAVKIQRWFRTKTNAGQMWKSISKIVGSAKMIQRNYRSSKWTRLLNAMGKDRRNKAATMIQQYIRGYMNRSKFWVDNRDNNLDRNFKFFDQMKLKLETDAAIIIQFQAKKFLMKKKLNRIK